MSKADLALLITMGVLLLLVVGIVLVGIRPLWARFGKLQREQDKTAKELAELEERADILGQLAKEERTIANLGRRAAVYLPTSVASAPFLMDVAAIGGLSGTNVPSVSFQEGEAKKGASTGVAEHPITMTVEGQFGQLLTFLGNLENNLRFTTFSGITISQQKDILSLQLAGTIFSKAEVKEYKDTSLELTAKIRKLLTDRREFGGQIQEEGPGRPDPFSGL